MSQIQRIDYYYNKLAELCERQAEMVNYNYYDDYMSEGSNDWASVSGYTDLHGDSEDDEELDHPIEGPIRKGPCKFFNPHTHAPYSKFRDWHRKRGGLFRREIGGKLDEGVPGEIGHAIRKRLYCTNGCTIRSIGYRYRCCPYGKGCYICQPSLNHIRGKSGDRKQMTESFF